MFPQITSVPIGAVVWIYEYQRYGIFRGVDVWRAPYVFVVQTAPDQVSHFCTPKAFRLEQ